MAPEIELEKLISDSLYLDNQAHAVVARMRDMDCGTKSQLRRLYNAVRRAVRAPESERQHQFVMLRARLAYTIARHSLRSLDALERLLLAGHAPATTPAATNDSKICSKRLSLTTNRRPRGI